MRSCADSVECRSLCTRVARALKFALRPASIQRGSSPHPSEGHSSPRPRLRARASSSDPAPDDSRSLLVSLPSPRSSSRSPPNDPPSSPPPPRVANSGDAGALDGSALSRLMTLRFLRVGAPAIFPSCSSSFALRSSSVTRLDEKRASPPGGASGEEEEAPPRWPWYRCAHRQSCVDHSRSSGSATLAAPSSLRTRYASWISLNFSCAPSSSRAMSGWYRRHRRRNARFSASRPRPGRAHGRPDCVFRRSEVVEQKERRGGVMREAKNMSRTTRAGPGSVGCDGTSSSWGGRGSSTARDAEGDSRRGGRPAAAAARTSGVEDASRRGVRGGGPAPRRGASGGWRIGSVRGAALAARVPRLARGVFDAPRVRPMSSAARRRPSSVQICLDRDAARVRRAAAAPAGCRALTQPRPPHL